MIIYEIVTAGIIESNPSCNSLCDICSGNCLAQAIGLHWVCVDSELETHNNSLTLQSQCCADLV